MSVSAGDPYLRTETTPAIEQAARIAEVTDDCDGERRPSGPSPAVEADEYVGEARSHLYLPLTPK